jgi:hypothetical protein
MSSFEPNTSNIETQSEEDNRIKEKPKILPLSNGPYYLLNDMQPKIVENLLNSEGKQFSTIIGIALCRCGFFVKIKLLKMIVANRRTRAKVMLARRLQFMIIGEFAIMLLSVNKLPSVFKLLCKTLD